MNYRIFPPDKIEARIELPASKSVSNRMLTLNALCGGKSTLLNVAECDNTRAMAAALESAGDYINIGAAGTAMRFLTAYFAACPGRAVTLDGSPRMRQRPIGILVDALRGCGASIEYVGQEGYPPLKITGRKLSAARVEMSGQVSSQYISAMLMIAPLMGCRQLTLTGEVVSRPYIAMTLSLMRLMGVDCAMTGNVISIPPGAAYRPAEVTIEGDWSAASYWYEIAALLPGSDITLTGLPARSVQGDSAVAGLFRMMGVESRPVPGGVRLTSGQAPGGLAEMNLADTPDLAQTMAVTLCLMDRHFNITGLKTLKIKETDRIEALRSQLMRLGYVVNATADFGLSWRGERSHPEENPRIATFADHRMALAFAPAAVKFPGIVIEDAQVTGKSYPGFWSHLESAGFKLEKEGPA